jgi:adenosylmethionine-8-amino-7-oxononanoate aminotransferase
LLEIERAEGVFLFEPQKKKYFDLISGVSVSSLGHNSNRYEKAAEDQLKKHMHLMVYGEFVQDPQLNLPSTL